MSCMVIALQVHGFRVALWAEHTGIVSPNFAFPKDLDCVREIRQIGIANWNVRSDIYRT